MKFTAKTFGLALGASLMTTVGAFASTIDLTDNGSYTTKTSTSATGSVTEADWTVTSNPSGQLTYTTFDGGSAPSSSLAFELDGVGVIDDEVGYPRESLTMTFSTAVDVTGIYTLDLFGYEAFTVYANGDASTGISLGTYGGAQPPYPTDGGYGYFAIDTDLEITSLTFYAERGNDCGANPQDCLANPDFALAAVDIAPIPVPAAGLLLLGGLGGLGMLKRRRKA